MYATRRLHGHAAPDVPGRRPQAARTSTRSRPSCATSCSASSGQFPLFHFWGPTADIVSTRWIARSALRVLERAAADADARLPAAPRLRPAAPRARRTRRIAARRRRGGRALRRAHRARRARRGARSSCCPSTASPRSRGRCTSTARCARPAGSRCARSSAASSSTPAPREAFAVADHQIAHVYVARPGARAARSRRCCATLPGVERVLDARGQARGGPRPPALGRAGRGRRRATAGSPTTTGSTTRARRTSRAPSTSTASRATTRSSCSSTRSSGCRSCAIGLRLAQKVLGLRYLMDVIPLDATLVRGSHGRPTDRAEDGPLFITSEPELLRDGPGRGDRGQATCCSITCSARRGAALRRTA